LFAATGLFELDRRVPHPGKPAVIYARDKKRQGLPGRRGRTGG
jgi:hypothetical protein